MDVGDRAATSGARAAGPQRGAREWLRTSGVAGLRRCFALSVIPPCPSHASWVAGLRAPSQSLARDLYHMCTASTSGAQSPLKDAQRSTTQGIAGVGGGSPIGEGGSLDPHSRNPHPPTTTRALVTGWGGGGLAPGGAQDNSYYQNISDLNQAFKIRQQA